MPRVNKLDGIDTFHTTRKFGETGSLEFVEQLDNIKVHIIDSPSSTALGHTLADFLLNTWNDEFSSDWSDDEIEDMIQKLFRFELLPTAMETIGITWHVSGMDMVDTTHLIRHRLFSFAAQVHGDRDMRDDKVVVKPGWMANPELYERYKQITQDAWQLYKDAMDSGDVHGLDARTIMPRNFSHFYNVRCNIKDVIGYCNMRKDEQIQTTVDNVIAMKLWIAISKRYPFLKHFVNFDAQDDYYVRQSTKKMTNIFPPNAKNDKFDWHEDMFFHPIGRDEFAGGDVYLKIREKLLAELKDIKPVSWSSCKAIETLASRV